MPDVKALIAEAKEIAEVFYVDGDLHKSRLLFSLVDCLEQQAAEVSVLRVLTEAQDDLLAAFRLGRNHGCRAIDTIRKARAELERIHAGGGTRP